MRKNYISSPYAFSTRSFLVNENSIINVALKKENEIPVTIIQESVIRVGNDSILEKGDLVFIS